MVNTCSWQGQLARTRSWKVLSWKAWSWTSKLLLIFPNSIETFQLRKSLFNFSCTFQLQSELSNFSSNFSTSPLTFQLRLELSNFNLSNFILDFPTSRSFQLAFPTTRILSQDLALLCYEVTVFRSSRVSSIQTRIKFNFPPEWNRYDWWQWDG